MSDTDAFKLAEAGLLLAALIGFVWWQRRDLEKARRETARQREAERAAADQEHTP
jgi:hypothetical protein